MQTITSYVLLVPLILWSVFQPLLYINAMMVEETLQLAIYEGQKEASLIGEYNESITNEMKDYLALHNYDASEVVVTWENETTGTMTKANRGERLIVTVSVPKPRLDFFGPSSDGRYTVTRTVMSEYIP